MPEQIIAVLKCADDVFSNVIQRRIPLDSAEYMANRVINATAEGKAGGDSIMKAAKDESAAIQEGQVATRTACIKIKTAMKVLSMHVQTFSELALTTHEDGGMTSEELSKEKDKLSDACATFVKDLGEIVANTEDDGKAMLARCQKQMEALSAGSQAVSKLTGLWPLKKARGTMQKSSRMSTARW